MDPITLGISAGAPILGGLLGNILSQGDRQNATNLINEAYADSAFSAMPPDQQAPVILEKLKQAGIYTPELEQALPQLTSAMQQIKEDPELRQSQLSALGKFQQQSETGMSPEVQAALNKARKQQNVAEQAKQGQIKQEMQARGLGGSGSELAQRLLSAQGSAQESSEEGDRLAAQNADIARSALDRVASLSGQVRQQDFGNEAAKAQAQDAIAQFNAQAAQQRQARNVQNQNQGQMYNLSEQQRIADANAQMANQEKYRQLGAGRQLWQDKITGAQNRAQGATAMANMSLGNAQQTAQMWQGMGQAVGAGAGAAASAGANQGQNNYYQELANRLKAPKPTAAGKI